MAHDALHLILQLELLFLEGDFFDLFGFREVLAGSETVNAFVEVVMLSGELAERTFWSIISAVSRTRSVTSSPISVIGTPEAKTI